MFGWAAVIERLTGGLAVISWDSRTIDAMPRTCCSNSALSNADHGAGGLPDDGVGDHLQASQNAGGRLAADHQQIGFQLPGQMGDDRRHIAGLDAEGRTTGGCLL